MKYTDRNFFIILVASALILIPSFALISTSQSDTSADDTSPEAISSNDTFSTISRELAQNQSESEDDINGDDN